MDVTISDSQAVWAAALLRVVLAGIVGWLLTQSLSVVAVVAAFALLLPMVLTSPHQPADRSDPE